MNPDAYDPANPEAWDTWRFFRDWAGAQFLTETAGCEAHAPMFYGGNVEHGFIVIEDLGEHTSLVEPLLGSDAAAATDALVAFAGRLGRMHASTIGKEQMYRDIQRCISPAWVEITTAKPSDARQSETEKQIVAFAELCQRVGVEPTKTSLQEFSSVLQRLEEPGPFKAFIHCDPCPDNTFFHAPHLKLIDFEFSCFGHALQDGLYGRLHFPTCWCANAVPPEVVRKMEDTYRKELSSACPEVLDDHRFGLESSAVTANWAFTSTQWGLNDLAEQDEDWGTAGCRSRILTRIEVFLEVARSSGHLPALCDTYGEILAVFQRNWPDASRLPKYPVFRTE